MNFPCQFCNGYPIVTEHSTIRNIFLSECCDCTNEFPEEKRSYKNYYICFGNAYQETYIGCLDRHLCLRICRSEIILHHYNHSNNIETDVAEIEDKFLVDFNNSILKISKEKSFRIETKEVFDYIISKYFENAIFI